MPDDYANQILDQLDEAKRQFGVLPANAIERLLARLERQKIKDPASLIRYHELLLFVRAYPHSARVQRLAESELKAFGKRIGWLTQVGVDLSLLGSPEVSGIANTAVTDTFSYNIVCWLEQKHSAEISFDWEWFEDENRLAQTFPRFLPLLEEDAAVEANVPYQKWLKEARGRVRETSWLLQRFQSLALTDKQKAELYDSLKLYVRWEPKFAATRTGMRLGGHKPFYHRRPLIRRQEVSLEKEILAPASPIEKLSPAQGEKILDLARETSTVRYRELYGFTHGDSARVLRAQLGRGIELFIAGLPAKKRLPLRAYHAAMIFKNGVPVGYFEGLSFLSVWRAALIFITAFARARPHGFTRRHWQSFITC